MFMSSNSVIKTFEITTSKEHIAQQIPNDGRNNRISSYNPVTEQESEHIVKRNKAKVRPPNLLLFTVIAWPHVRSRSRSRSDLRLCKNTSLEGSVVVRDNASLSQALDRLVTVMLHQRFKSNKSNNMRQLKQSCFSILFQNRSSFSSIPLPSLLK